MDTESIRRRSLERAAHLGYDVIESLPLLESVSSLKPPEAILDRFLCLHAVVASAYGFDRTRARDWLSREDLVSALALSERRFLADGIGDPNRFKCQVEGLWAFAWALGIVVTLDFGKLCANTFVFLLPDLKKFESSRPFRERARLRSMEEIAGQCDLAYCLHWAVRQAQIERRSLTGKVPPYVVIERRRALEWILGEDEDEWDDISLDT